MFNNIDSYIFNEICDMLFAYHNMMINTVGQLNKLYNACYCPKCIKEDILDILQQDVYMCEVNLAQMGF